MRKWVVGASVVLTTVLVLGILSGLLGAPKWAAGLLVVVLVSSITIAVVVRSRRSSGTQ
jgi:hypothetical protein